MKAFLQKHLGPNYIVRIFGYLTVACVAVVADPSLVEFLPDAVESAVLGAAKFIAVISGAITINSVKGANVTGGTVPANHEAADRVAKEKALEVIIKAEPIEEERIPRPLISLRDDE